MISLNNAHAMPARNVLSSNILGSKRVGNLRSPIFKIEYDQILFRAKSKKIFMRLVIDNYHMGKYSGLLFGGLLLRRPILRVILSGLVYHLKNTKVIGHTLNLLIEVKTLIWKLTKSDFPKEV